MVLDLSTTELAGLLMLAGLLPILPAIWYVWDLRDKPGVIWFILAMVAAGAWTLTAGLNPFIDDPDVTITLFNLRHFAVSLAAVFWLLLAFEYSFKRHTPTLLFGVLVVFPLVTQFLLWTNHIHGLVYTLEVGVDQTRLVTFSPEAWWYLDTTYNYILVMMGAGMWLGDLLSSHGERRRQTALFLVSTALLTAAAVVFSTGMFNPLEPLDPTPVSFVIAGLFIAYALFKYQLFQVAPVAHQTTIQEMDDAVVILNSDDKVADTNPLARRLFNSESPVGLDLAEFFSGYPTLIEKLDGTDNLQSEVEIDVDGGERYFDLNVTAIEEGRDIRGRVVVLRDISSLKQREEELELVKGVLTRVFRHNVRNDLTVIRGYGEVIEEREDGEIGELAGEIVAKGDELLDKSEKARFIEDVIDSQSRTRTADLQMVVEHAIDTYRTQYPDVIFEIAALEDVAITVHPNFETAIEQVVENAIEHHDGTPTIAIYTEREGQELTLYIEDDGPGIPENEISTILEGEETPLQHGSGIGLWLVHWIIERSGGELHLENTESGGRVGFRLVVSTEAIRVIE